MTRLLSLINTWLTFGIISRVFLTNVKKQLFKKSTRHAWKYVLKPFEICKRFIYILKYVNYKFTFHNILNTFWEKNINIYI